MPHNIDKKMFQIYEQSVHASSNHGNKISVNEAFALIQRSEELNSSAYGFFCCVTSSRGKEQLSRLINFYRSNFTPESLRLINNYLINGETRNNFVHPVNSREINVEPIEDEVFGVDPHSKLILHFEAKKPTWKCHWFPMQETTPGGDPVNNLFAPNGPLHKYDRLTGSDSRSYEFNHNRKTKEQGKEYAWWGHCNKAAEAACVLVEPKQDVVLTDRSGGDIRFTINDIQGLLVKVISHLIDRVDFKGNRFNGGRRDDPNDPRPEIFLKVVQDWAKDTIPFVLDIEKTEQVWNYPYDKVRIYESLKPPAHFNPLRIGSSGGFVTYYHCRMSGTGYNDEKRIYEFYIQRDHWGNVLSSSWIKTPNSNDNPDFLWRPYPVGNLMDKANWRFRAGNTNNPLVDPQVVYDIYMRSVYDSAITRVPLEYSRGLRPGTVLVQPQPVVSV